MNPTVSLSSASCRKRSLLWGSFSVLAALLIAAADYLLEFNPDYGVGATIVERAWADMDLRRFSVSLNVCAFAIPFFLPGLWLLRQQLARTNRRLANVVCGLFVYGIVMGSPLIHGIMSVNPFIYRFALDNGLSHDAVSILIERDITGAILPVFLIHYGVTWMMAPLILFVYVISGRSIFPRWTAVLNPLVFLLVGYAGLELLPGMCRYLVPGSINKGNAAMFALALYYSTRTGGDSAEDAPGWGTQEAQG